MSIAYGPAQAPASVETAREPATAAEAWAALTHEGPTADAVRSYLAGDVRPRYDTPQARAKAQAQAELEAGE